MADIYPRTISHRKGSTLLSHRPQRIATTNFVAAEHLLTLGIAPCASVSLSALEAFPIYHEELRAYAGADLGEKLDEKRLAAASPDLIISFEWDKSDYERLSAIAPTVVFGGEDEVELLGTYFGPVADAAGRSAAKTAFLSRYEAARSEAKAALAQAGCQGLTALFLMVSNSAIYVYTGWTTRVYYEELGLVLCPGLEGKTAIKREQLLQCDPDMLFVARMYTGGEKVTRTLADDPAWSGLKAVREGRVYETDASIMGPVAKGQLHGMYFIKHMLQVKGQGEDAERL